MNLELMIQPLQRLPFEYRRIEVVVDLSEFILPYRLLKEDEVHPAETGEVESQTIGLDVDVVRGWDEGKKRQSF